MPLMSQKTQYNDIKIIFDTDVDERVNFIIKCENNQELQKLIDYFHVKSKNTKFEKIRQILCI